jgi:hypothetical protein
MGYEEFLLIPWLILLCENGSWISLHSTILSAHCTFFNERIMMAIIQEDENFNTSRRRVVESSE